MRGEDRGEDRGEEGGGGGSFRLCFCYTDYTVFLGNVKVGTKDYPLDGATITIDPNNWLKSVAQTLVSKVISGYDTVIKKLKEVKDSFGKNENAITNLVSLEETEKTTVTDLKREEERSEKRTLEVCI